MPNYRVYFIDLEGRFCAVEVIEADTDAAAIQHAELLRDGKPVEVWSAARAVARLAARVGRPD